MMALHQIIFLKQQIRFKQHGAKQAPTLVITSLLGFNQRRKTLRNALKQLSLPLDAVPAQLLSLRAEQLSVNDFITLTKSLS